MIGNYNYGTGRRKSSVARVFIKKGTGKIEVNGKPLDQYFGRQTSIMIVQQPLLLTANIDAFDVRVNVHGGGESVVFEALGKIGATYGAEQREGGSDGSETAQHVELRERAQQLWLCVGVAVGAVRMIERHTRSVLPLPAFERGDSVGVGLQRQRPFGSQHLQQEWQLTRHRLECAAVGKV